jgi:hypothetical protein
MRKANDFTTTYLIVSNNQKSLLAVLGAGLALDQLFHLFYYPRPFNSASEAQRRRLQYPFLSCLPA